LAMSQVLDRDGVLRPLVQAVQTKDRYRQKQDEHQPERMRSCFELSPDQKPPARASQILDHQKSQTAETDARPEDERDEIRTKEGVFGVVGVARNYCADNPEEDADQPHTRRDFLDSSEISRRSVFIVHQLPCPPEVGVGAGAPVSDFPPDLSAASNFCLSSAFNSLALASWLACSARM